MSLAAPQKGSISLRASILALGVAGLVYVAVLGLVVKLAIQPSTTRLSVSSKAVLDEYRGSSMRAAQLDAAITDLWRLLGVARVTPVPIDTLEPIRQRLESMVETSATVDRLSAAVGDRSELREILAAVVVHEDMLRSEVLGALGSLEIGDVTMAERMLRRADLLDTPLSEALNRATTIALQQMTGQEDGLQRAVSAMNLIVWIWLLGGLVSLPLLAGFLRRRLHAPLARLDNALNRIRAGDLAVTLEADRPDELGRLVEHFNRMTAVLRQRAAEDEQRAEDRTAARMKLILDSALDAVVVIDSSGVIKEWSPQAEQVFGWTRDEIIDKKVSDTIVPPDYRDAHIGGLARYALTGEARMTNRRMELAALRRDGTRFPIEITITPIKRGTQTEFSAFIRDITDSKRAQVALAESEARYRAAFEQVAVGMVELDLGGKYLRVNPAFAEFVGRPVEDIIGRRFVDLTHPDDRASDESIYARLTSGDSLIRRQKRYVRPDGTVAAASLTAAMVRDAAGNPLYVLTVVEDVTAQKRLEEELRQAHKMDAVGQLAGGFAHDFNNLLTAIIGFADLLRRTEDAPDIVREDAEAILATAERGADLARSLLTLARTAPAPDAAVDVNQVISEVGEIVSRTFDRRISIRLDLAAAETVVTGDRSLLTNAVLNLALNARDAMPNGGQLSISTRDKQLNSEDCFRLADLVTPGPFLVVRVEDTGTGMSPEVQQRAFEPFFTTKPSGKGTGIGLSMVYGTLRSHSGAIELESTQGAGTTFTLYLPLRPLEVESVAPTSTRVESGTGRILLADDEDLVRDVARRMLERLGYDVDVAIDGEDAIARVLADPARFDLIILDGNMPRVPGREAALRIRDAVPGMRMLLASGYIEPRDLERLSNYGFSAVITKPYTLSDLSRVVAEQLAKPEAKGTFWGV